MLACLGWEGSPIRQTCRCLKLSHTSRVERAGPSLHSLLYLKALAVGGWGWVKLIRTFSRIQPWLPVSHPTYNARGWFSASAIPTLPPGPAFHPGADRDRPQRPECGSSPEESFGPAALYGRYSALISSLEWAASQRRDAWGSGISRDLGGFSPRLTCTPYRARFSL